MGIVCIELSPRSASQATSAAIRGPELCEAHTEEEEPVSSMHREKIASIFAAGQLLQQMAAAVTSVIKVFAHVCEWCRVSGCRQPCRSID